MQCYLRRFPIFQAAQLKDKGNSALKGGDLQKAVEFYTDAILLDPTNHVLYSNRSAAFAQDKKYEQALADGKKCVELKPDWGKVIIYRQSPKADKTACRESERILLKTKLRLCSLRIPQGGVGFFSLHTLPPPQKKKCDPPNPSPSPCGIHK